MQALVGKTIRGVEVNDDETLLRFQCDGGPVTFEVDGDCCSSSWFADVVGYDVLAGGTVREVRAVELETGKVPPDDVPSSPPLIATGRSRQEIDALYGYVITTDRGRCTIAFRNSSNGYYGGNLHDSIGEHPDAKWRAITDDWSA